MCLPPSPATTTRRCSCRSATASAQPTAPGCSRIIPALASTRRTPPGRWIRAAATPPAIRAASLWWRGRPTPWPHAPTRRLSGKRLLRWTRGISKAPPLSMLVTVCGGLPPPNAPGYKGSRIFGAPVWTRQSRLKLILLSGRRSGKPTAGWWAALRCV